MSTFLGFLLFLSFSCIPHVLSFDASSLDALDIHGNITIKWDIMSWTEDGYIAQVRLVNNQQYRHIELPGWVLGWTWTRREVIWEMLGAQASMQGDCSHFKGRIPHCCKKSPTIVDLLLDAPDEFRVANCCRSGVLSTVTQDPINSEAAFQITIGNILGTNNATVTPPTNFTIGLGTGYVCSPAIIVQSSLFPAPDGRRFTQALRTWNVTCRFVPSLANKAPSCCVSYSTFYHDIIYSCPECACSCSYTQRNMTHDDPPMCYSSKGMKISSPGFSNDPNVKIPQLYCSKDMCPTKVHWHVKSNYYGYWRAKVTITNRSFKNHTNWNMVIQHPNVDNLLNSFSFNYMKLQEDDRKYDAAMLWGIKYYNDMLLSAGPYGNVQTELLFKKDGDFTLSNGWVLPRHVIFNGDECVMPPLDEYPPLPGKAFMSISSHIMTVSIILIMIVVYGG